MALLDASRAASLAGLPLRPLVLSLPGMLLRRSGGRWTWPA